MICTGKPYLHDGQQGVQAVQARARRRHGHADDRQGRQRGHHAGQVRGAARACDDDLTAHKPDCNLSVSPQPSMVGLPGLLGS